MKVGEKREIIVTAEVVKRASKEHITHLRGRAYYPYLGCGAPIRNNARVYWITTPPLSSDEEDLYGYSGYIHYKCLQVAAVRTKLKGHGNTTLGT